MKLHHASTLAIVLALTGAPAFASGHADSLAVVNGKAIPASRLETVIKSAVAQGQKDTPELRASLKEQLIAQEVMRQEAERRGYTKNPQVAEAIEESRSSIPIRAMMTDLIKGFQISDAEVKAAYDNYATHLGAIEYSTSDIVVRTEAEAKDLIAKIKGGAKFEDLSKNSLDKATAANGGKLDWTPVGSFIPALGQALAGLKKGQLDETPVQTEHGFHVLRLDDTRPFTPPSLEALKPRIVAALQEQKAKAFAADLRKQATVK
jgi:peptidyl-prolyl cis-trans isomerase C